MRIVLFVLLVACSKSPPPAAPSAPEPVAVEPKQETPPPASDPGDAALAKLAEFKDQICACKDKACADAVMKGMMEWGEEFERTHSNLKPTKEQEARADAISSEMTPCMQRLMNDGSATP
jgi:hypothetical protein